MDFRNISYKERLTRVLLKLSSYNDGIASRVCYWTYQWTLLLLYLVITIGSIGKFSNTLLKQYHPYNKSIWPIVCYDVIPRFQLNGSLCGQ